MKCAYCGQQCSDRGYGNNDYKEYNVEMNNGLELVIRIHNKCLPKILGEWTRNKVHPVLYSAPYDHTVRWNYEPSVTYDTACESVKITKQGE